LAKGKQSLLLNAQHTKAIIKICLLAVADILGKMNKQRQTTDSHLVFYCDCI